MPNVRIRHVTYSKRSDRKNWFEIKLKVTMISEGRIFKDSKSYP